MTAALNFIHLFPLGTSRVPESSLHLGQEGKVQISFTVLLPQQFLCVALAHADHPHLKKSIPLVLTVSLLKQKKILKRSNSYLCGSGLFC